MPEMPTDQEVAEAIAAVMRAKRMGKREAARLAEVGTSTLIRWTEGGDDMPPMNQTRGRAEGFLAKVARAEPLTPGDRMARRVAQDMLDRIEAALTSADEAAGAAGRVAKIEDQDDQRPSGTDE